MFFKTAMDPVSVGEETSEEEKKIENKYKFRVEYDDENKVDRYRFQCCQKKNRNDNNKGDFDVIY
jgi:hypothetical protein